MTDLPSPSIEGGEPSTEAGRKFARHVFSATEAHCEADILAIEAEARQQVLEQIRADLHTATDPAGDDLAHWIPFDSIPEAQKSTADLALQRSKSRHAAWCFLPADHDGACDGDQ